MDRLVGAACSFASFAPAAAPDAMASAGLSLGGAIFMCVSIAGVLTLVVLCYARLLRSRPDESESSDRREDLG